MDQAGALDGEGLREVARRFRDQLRSYREPINRLNVFPVPDGDTGTNMTLTMDSVVEAVNALEPGATLEEVGKALSHASLMGARGNSGVILSQVLRGLAEAFGSQSSPEVGPSELAGALRRAAEDARRAVQKPAEGTILSVADAAAAGAARASGGSLADVALGAEEEARLALARTPEQLEVLARAGVVDAGGAGLVLFYDALRTVIAGGEPGGLDGDLVPQGGDPGAKPAMGVAREPDNQEFAALSGLRYEVMFLLEAPDEAIAPFREAWAELGDSIVVVGGRGLWNCHIHTDDIGAALEAAMDVGRPRQIRVSDLLEQVEEESWVRAGGADGAGGTQLADAGLASGVVAIAAGEGLGQIFASLGASRVLVESHGRSPSVAQLLGAIASVPAEQVLVLPNNKNVVPVAEQAARLSPKAVAVVPTREATEGIAAACEFDPGSGMEDNLARMTAAASKVVATSVSQAVKAAPGPEGPIKAGDWVAMSAGAILVVAASPSEAACGILAKLATPDHELVTLVEGEGDWASETDAITAWLAEHAPHLGLEVHQGGQAVFAYLIGIE